MVAGVALELLKVSGRRREPYLFPSHAYSIFTYIQELELIFSYILRSYLCRLGIEVRWWPSYHSQSFLSTSEPEVTTFDNKMGLSAGPMYRHAAVVLGTLANLVRFPIAVWQCSADCTVTLHCPPPPKAPLRDRAEVLFWRVCFACVGGCWPRFCKVCRFCDPIHIHGSRGPVKKNRMERARVHYRSANIEYSFGRAHNLS